MGMDDTYATALVRIAEVYEAEASAHGGKSLARVATIVVNRGSFFERLRSGDGFSVKNLDRFAAWFRDPANWPQGAIPQQALDALQDIGRPAIEPQAEAA